MGIYDVYVSNHEVNVNDFFVFSLLFLEYVYIVSWSMVQFKAFL